MADKPRGKINSEGNNARIYTRIGYLALAVRLAGNNLDERNGRPMVSGERSYEERRGATRTRRIRSP